MIQAGLPSANVAVPAGPAAQLSPRSVAWISGGLAATGPLLLALVIPLYFVSNMPTMMAAIGAGLGTTLVHTTLAAAWAALGPGRTAVRVPLSLVWVMATAIAGGIHWGRMGPGPQVISGIVGFSAHFAILLAGMWALAAALFRGLAIARGLRVQKAGKLAPANKPVRQFDLRTLLVVVTAAAVTLAIARLLIQVILATLRLGEGALLLVPMIALADLLQFAPFLLGMLRSRRAALAGLLLVGLVIVAELLVFATVLRSFGPMFGLWSILGFNVAQVGWIFAFVGVLRLGGYRLSTGDGQESRVEPRLAELAEVPVRP